MSANTHKILYHVTRQARKPDAMPEATLTVAPPGRRVHTQGKQPINSPGFAPPIPSVQPRDFSFSEERRKSPPGWSIKSRPLPACSDCLVYPSRRLACATVNSSIFTMNSTLFSATPETYWSHFEEISKYNVHLNVFERLWVAWYAFMQNDVLATGIMSFVIHEVVYFGRCLPWIIIDSFGLFKQYKIQTNKTPSAKEQWDCAKLVLLSHFTVELPQIWLFHPMAQYFGLSTTVPFPSLWTMAYQIPIFFVMEDTWHYFSHRAFHWGPLYKTVHKIHHQYSAPFGLAAEYASPIEVMALGLGTVASPILWCAFTKDLHILTMYIWIVLRLLQAIDAHSGYEFPWSLHHFLPFWAGADHHDVHHEKFVGNYASSFRWWDYMLDTEYTPESVKRWREKKLEKAQKKAN